MEGESFTLCIGSASGNKDEEVGLAGSLETGKEEEAGRSCQRKDKGGEGAIKYFSPLTQTF